MSIIEMEERINIENFCPICSREDIGGDMRCITNCEHIYCKECLEDWLRRGNISCPLCRRDIINYTNDEIINQIICIDRNNRNNNINNNNNNQIRIPGRNRQSIQNEIRFIIIQNVRMRYLIYLCFFWIFCLGILYKVLYDQDKYIEEEYLICEYNNTVLRNELIETIRENRLETEPEPEIFSMMIRAGEIYHCSLPKSVYKKCYLL